MKKKLGPLPVWAWGVIFGVAGYLYLRQRGASSSSSSTSPTASVLDPNAIDPNTGLTYGQEESAAMNGGLAATSGGSGGSGTTATDGNLGASGDLTGQFGSFDQELMAFLQAQQDFGQLAGALGYVTPTASPTTTTAAASPPLSAASPPTTTPSTHQQIVAHAVGHSPNYQGPGRYVAAGPTSTSVKAIGHSVAYRGPGQYVAATAPKFPADWGPRTRAAGHKLAGHSVRY